MSAIYCIAVDRDLRDEIISNLRFDGVKVWIGNPARLWVLCDREPPTGTGDGIEDATLAVDQDPGSYHWLP